MRQLPAKPVLFLLILLALELCGPAYAQDPDTAVPAFEAGKSAFRAGDYDTALEQFEGAIAAGQAGPAVYYNVGVCQYKLGNYLDSWAAFRKVADYPSMAPLAYYNLGLVESARGSYQAADDWYRLTMQYAEDEQLQAMAKRMLGSRQPVKPASAWHGILLAEAGYDDNVRLRNDLFSLPDDANLDSSVGMIFGSISGPYTGGSGFLLDASFYLTQNPDADDLDQFEVMGGSRYAWALADWRVELGGQLGYSTLDGDSYEEKGMLSFKIRKPVSRQFTMDFRYSYEDISAGEDIFDGIEGSRQRARLRGVWRKGETSVDLSYDYETNDRDSASVSSDRHRAQARYRYLFGPKWFLEMRAAFRRSEFKDLPDKREEDLVLVGGKLARRLGSKWEAYGDYSFGDNDSDDSAFSYTRNRIVLGASYVF